MGQNSRIVTHKVQGNRYVMCQCCNHIAICYAFFTLPYILTYLYLILFWTTFVQCSQKYITHFFINISIKYIYIFYYSVQDSVWHHTGNKSSYIYQLTSNMSTVSQIFWLCPWRISNMRDISKHYSLWSNQYMQRHTYQQNWKTRNNDTSATFHNISVCPCYVHFFRFLLFLQFSKNTSFLHIP